MEIIKAEAKDLAEILQIYKNARQFMKASGNPDQWGDTYPPKSKVEEDINTQDLYTVTECGKILAVFYFHIGVDETYRVIEDGSWLSDTPYAVIHRVAVNEQGRGIIRHIFDYCFSIHPNLRIDTHRQNAPMQKSLAKNGFAYCGIIHLPDGSERLAYQKL